MGEPGSPSNPSPLSLTTGPHTTTTRSIIIPPQGCSVWSSLGRFLTRAGIIYNCLLRTSGSRRDESWSSVRPVVLQEMTGPLAKDQARLVSHVRHQRAGRLTDHSTVACVFFLAGHCSCGFVFWLSCCWRHDSGLFRGTDGGARRGRTWFPEGGNTKEPLCAALLINQSRRA